VRAPVAEGIEGIGLEAVWPLHQKGEGTFVDARSPQEFRAGHIPRALLLSKDTFEETIASWKTLVPLDTLLITYCAGAGCESSREVAALLVEEGYSRVKVFFGGWEQWYKAGYPVEKSGSERTEVK
jgi:rhodanese-related sulfurtransferase